MVGNRKTGLMYLDMLLKLSKREKSFLTICFVEVDGLKAINDIYGHKEGDYLLAKMSRILKDSLRESDVLSRIGDNEFLLVFPKCSKVQAKHILKRADKKISEMNSKSIKPYRVKVFYGFGEFTPGEELTSGDLVEKSDNDKNLSRDIQ